MTDLDDVIHQLERRRNELEALIDEYRRVVGALDALQGLTSQAAALGGLGGPPTGRARRGERRAQILAALRRNPRANAREIANELGTNPANIYTQLRELERRGHIARGPEGYRVSA